jgi:hypothetical protein
VEEEEEVWQMMTMMIHLLLESKKGLLAVSF